MAKVLIVDDEPANRLLVATLLKYAGHDVLEAEDGAQGLELAQNGRPDLVIMDLSMPGMHGTQFVKTLRAQPETAGTRVALYTGTSVDAMLRDFMELHGIAHVIPKPAEPEEVLRAVLLALEA
jgi:CheY-like chemotaxis protein